MDNDGVMGYNGHMGIPIRSILYVLAKPWATVIGFSERICCISVA